MSDYYKNPPTYRQTTKKLADTAMRCVWAEMFSAGKSVMGKNLWAVGFGSRRGAVLYAGGFHATEWLTVMLLVRLIDELAAAVLLKEKLCGVDICAVIKRRGVIIIPCVNPDGTELFCGGFRRRSSMRVRYKK